MADIVSFTPRTAQDLLEMLRSYKQGRLGGRSGVNSPSGPREDVPQRLKFSNASGEEIPAYAAMRVTGATLVNGRLRMTCGKPNSDPQQVYVVNGPRAVPVGKGGNCFVSGVAEVLYNSSDGTPSFGQTWGPVNASWLAGKDKAGFYSLGGTNTEPERVLVFVGMKAATRCNATLAEDYTSGSGTVKVNNVVPLDGTSPVESETDELDVTIIFSGWGDADSGSNCKIGWNGTNERWEMDQMDCGGGEE